jgi:hypothetical protein
MSVLSFAKFPPTVQIHIARGFSSRQEGFGIISLNLGISSKLWNYDRQTPPHPILGKKYEGLPDDHPVKIRIL